MGNSVLVGAVLGTGALLACTAGLASGTKPIYTSSFANLGEAKLEFSERWSVENGALITRSDHWQWETATLDPGVDDYQLDAEVVMARTPNRNNGMGFIFRKSNEKAAAFYISQPLGGFGAFGQILGEHSRWSKECVYAISKDKEVGVHHLRALVKGSLANFYVDGELACILDITERKSGLVGLYAHGDATFRSFEVRPLAPGTKLVEKRQPRNLLRYGKVCPASTSWKQAIARAVEVIDKAIEEGTEGVPGEESMPAYTYRCCTWMKPGVRPFYAYPANHHAFTVEALVNYYSYSKERKYLREALRLADWMIRHSTPTTDKLAHLPYSTTMNGQMGGNVDGDTIMVDKCGVMGLAYLRLWDLCRQEKYKKAAIAMAETLLKLQLPEGRWQNRVENATGKVMQDYTAHQVANIRFMEALYDATGDERYKVSAAKALDWVLANPVKTGKWTGYYEDVESHIESVSNWDAIETARYLIANRHKKPGYLSLAIDIAQWVGTSFAVFQDGKWPLICEQSVCMPVMSVHTKHFAQLMLDLHAATGRKYYYDVAVSATNAGFDLAKGGEGWYSLELSPLALGIPLIQRLGIR